MQTKPLFFLLSFIGLIFSSQLAIASSDSGTLTPGTVTQFCPPTFTTNFTLVGVIRGSIGTYSPTGLTGGKTFNAITDERKGTCGTSSLSTFSATGFSSNPGSTWLTSITCNGVTNMGSSAIQFIYTSATGTAAWQWSQEFGLSNGSQVSCTIVHS
jgi:hypothetical protein